VDANIATSGVPRDSNLSPLLFSIFVNSANRVLQHARLLAFADDVMLFFRIDSLHGCSKLQALYSLVF